MSGNWIENAAGSPLRRRQGRVLADGPPPGYLPPPLNPTGVVLETRRLGEGVYALLSNTPFADNAGFVVGAESVLVVDSGFNGRIGQQIIDAVKRVTGKRFDISSTRMRSATTSSANYVFPRETRIIATRRTLDALRGTTIPEMAARMARRSAAILSVFAGVELRSLTRRSMSTGASIWEGDGWRRTSSAPGCPERYGCLCTRREGRVVGEPGLWRRHHSVGAVRRNCDLSRDARAAVSGIGDRDDCARARSADHRCRDYCVHAVP
jgi:hypothetical protein